MSAFDDAMLAILAAYVLWYHVLFPPGAVPAPEPLPPQRPEWPAPPRRVCGFRQRSRFAVASVLFGDAPVMRTYAAALARSVRARVRVDLVLFSDTEEVPPWRTCAPPDAWPHPQFRKLLAWNLTTYEAVLVLDLDTLVLGNIAPLFDAWPARLRAQNASFAAADDQPVHWTPRWAPPAEPRFNAGVLLVLPNTDVFAWLRDGVARVQYADDMREQAYLNAALWRRRAVLPGVYNAMITTAYAEPRTTWARLVDEGVRILHFTFPKAHDRDACAAHYVADICALWPGD